MRQSYSMPQPLPPKQKLYQDDWGTSAREGYEDRGAFRPPRAPQKQPGSPILKTVGGLCIFGALCWAAYLYTQDFNLSLTLQNHGPVAIMGIGAVCSIIGKYVRW
jgi:hypothetical protein